MGCLKVHTGHFESLLTCVDTSRCPGLFPDEVIFSYVHLFCNGLELALEVPRASVAAGLAKPRCFLFCQNYFHL